MNIDSGNCYYRISSIFRMPVLEIDLDETAVNNIKREVEFSSMKRENPDHVRKGSSGGWVQILTDIQKKQAERIAGPMLSLLNYSIRDDKINNFEPFLPVKLQSSEINKAIAQACT